MPDADLALANRWQRGFPLDPRPFAGMGVPEQEALSSFRALRERGADLPLLIDYLFDRVCSELGVSLSLSAATRRVLLSHGWPGNVRELDHCLRQAIVFAKGLAVEADDLPAVLGTGRDLSFSKPLPAGFNLTAASAQLAATYEGEEIRRALVDCGGNQSAAARALGIDRRTLYVKIRQLKIVG